MEDTKSGGGGGVLSYSSLAESNLVDADETTQVYHPLRLQTTQPQNSDLIVVIQNFSRNSKTKSQQIFPTITMCPLCNYFQIYFVNWIVEFRGFSFTMCELEPP